MQKNSFGDFRVEDLMTRQKVNKIRRPQHKRYSPAQRDRAILNYIAQNEGQPLNDHLIGIGLGYANSNPIRDNLKGLLKRNLIRKFKVDRSEGFGKSVRYRFYLTGSPNVPTMENPVPAKQRAEKPRATATSKPTVSHSKPLETVLVYLRDNTAKSTVEDYALWLINKN